ncbi:hypothetical protein [Peterkaempfera bronchialis]|uniref:Uncharacterized protein n=1 Tax=Peterkaempfera bronchialis TaxID=2126346 RepID=A0A345SRJ9_9ACTN|nr:hypothetical protein [Peterkaempfera bronchialis]AXI76354.1 hypothetical protein C7M71_001540 [Peterkaempfera bronchialis]
MAKSEWARAIVYCRKGEAIGPEAAMTHFTGDALIEGRWVHFRPDGGGRPMSIPAQVIQRIVWVDESSP